MIDRECALGCEACGQIGTAPDSRVCRRTRIFCEILPGCSRYRAREGVSYAHAECKVVPRSIFLRPCKYAGAKFFVYKTIIPETY